MSDRLSGAIVGLLLCLAWLAAALWFQGGGFIDIEATHFLQHYLAERDLSAILLDVRRNDWDWYQAREFSYAVDWLDARVIGASIGLGVPHFYPFSHYAICLAIFGLHLRWGRRYFEGLPRNLLVLLGLLFLTSSHSFFGTFFRSAKDLAALWVFAFAVLGFVAPAGTGLARRFGLLALAIGMGVSDRQGIFFLGAFAATAGLLFVLLRQRRHAELVGILVAAYAFCELNNRVLTPALILATNGYSPNLEYQSLAFIFEALTRLLAGDGFGVLIESGLVLPDVVANFFGSFGRIGGILALIGLAAGFAWSPGDSDASRAAPQRGEWRLRPELWVLLAALPMLWAMSWVMSIKQDYMLQPENRILYYWAPLNALLLVAATGAAHRVLRQRPDWQRPLAALIGFLLIANLVALPRHRDNYIYPGSASTGHERAERTLRCLRTLDVDALTIGMHDREAALCRFMTRRFDPAFTGPPRRPKADYELGYRYVTGTDVPTDPAEALAWLRRAAGANHPPAMALLGATQFDEIAMAGTHAVPPSREQQIDFLERAARAGDGLAQYSLAVAYQQGGGVERDRVRSFAWASAAAQQGHERGKQLAAQLRGALAAEELKAGRELRRELLGRGQADATDKANRGD